jgi:AraC-like DNA-binding protein
VRLEGAAVVFHATNHRVRTRTRTQLGRLAYATFDPGAKGTMNGVPIRPELMLAVAPETEVQLVTDAGYESITVLIALEDIRAHLRARGREQNFRPPVGAETLQADPAMVRRLFDWGKRLVDTAARRPALFDDRKKQRDAAQVEMVETLLSTLDTTTDFERASVDRARQSQAAIVQAAEQYALSHVEERVYVTDLCRAAAVSERVLEYAFKENFGLTPVAYLTRLRLHRVRQALLAATQGSTTVSAAALDWGFWHFGGFSRAYKEFFGELPSDTLRRKPDAAER